MALPKVEGFVFKVRKVEMPGRVASSSWTLLHATEGVVEPVDEYVQFLEVLGRSSNTIRSYCYDLRLLFGYLDWRGVAWDEVDFDDLVAFVLWLKRPAGNVVALHPTQDAREPSTINRALAAVHGFYEFHQRRGVPVAATLIKWRPAQGRTYRPFLHHLDRGRPVPGRPLNQRQHRPRPKCLTKEEVAKLLAGCHRVRDRLMISLLYETGVRVGQALGLRHEDWISRERRILLRPRTDNANGARGKIRDVHEVAISPELVRLYSDYMHLEYGSLDSDYVFVNLWGQPHGHAWTYDGVYELVRRLRRTTGVYFTPHMFRHTHATELLREGVELEVVSKRLTHKNASTTSEIYSHLIASDVRAALERAGFLEEA